MKPFRIFVAALTLLVPSSPIFGQTPAPAPATAPSGKMATAAPTPAEIADAKAKGMVWVNTKTRVYHKDGTFYGNTKHGKFMTEDDATKAGYRAAKSPGAKSVPASAPGK